MSKLVVDLSEPADVADALALLGSIEAGGWPSANAGKPRREAEERPPWEDDAKPARNTSQRSSQRASNDDDSDPWADSASTRSSGSGRSSGRSSGSSASTTPGKDFPESGEYEKQAKSGVQVWTFGDSKSPECDCGHIAAKVEGYKGKDTPRGKPSWTAHWCPVGFGKAWKNKCEFSEFA